MGLYDSLAIPRLSISIPWGADGKKGSLPIVLLAAVPVVLPAAYLAYVLRQGARRTTATTSITPPDPLLGNAKSYKEGGDTLAIPSAVLAAPDRYIVAKEHVVSEAIPLRRILPGLRPGLDGEAERGLLETYLGTTMRMFTWTPQAFAMKSIVSRLPDGAAHANTFSTPYLDACLFEPGDRVCGVYVVREHIVNSSGGERVFLDLSSPEGWKGPTVGGVLDCGVVLEENEGEVFVRFVNQTVMWRTKDEKPTLLEGTVSRWLHTAMVGWMMVRGVEAVTGRDDTTTVKKA
ncbi:hypothetical protein E0Z10_g4409 [Xylaria hypoxylon]|uniref:Uncharacterized protein n=1 Tax=Xylaria hypoxylon TaxID=37992 RepID=A0A4Z0YJ28_9PEZI|nr:hypothetical protein E0Z10_g4409 [Xylaria hypoxylon]